MSDISEGIGAAVEGTLVGRAVEPEHGKGAKLDPDLVAAAGLQASGECLNCGTTIVGSYCHACGQKRDVHRTLSAIGHDIMHGVLHLDGKLWRTLPLLFFKPGKLTRRYIEGERARFVSPMAMFLFGVFLMFAVFQMVGIGTPTNIQPDTSDKIREAAQAEVAGLQERREELLADLEDDSLEMRERERLETRLSEVEANLQGIEEAQEQVPFIRDLLGTETKATQEVVGRVPVETAEDGSESIPISLDGEGNYNLTIGGLGFIEGAVQKWRDNPGLMLYKLQANSYKFSWLLIPLSIPFVWLLFAWKRRFKAYDHAIFVTYSLSFMTLLFIVLSIAGVLGLSVIPIILSVMLIPPIHIYKQLRGAYELSRFGALWRTTALLIFITMVLLMFLWLLLILGAF